MELLPFFIIDGDLNAAQFRDATAGQENRIEPRKIDDGPMKGKWAIPARVAVDPAFENMRDAFAVLNEVALDIDLAWPADAEARRAAEQG